MCSLGHKHFGSDFLRVLDHWVLKFHPLLFSPILPLGIEVFFGLHLVEAESVLRGFLDFASI